MSTSTGSQSPAALAPAGTLLLAAPGAPADRLAAALGAELSAVPEPGGANGWVWPWSEELASWRAAARASEPVPAAVVCAWPPSVKRHPLADLDAASWRGWEREYARWMTALTLACERCVDGGAVVLVVELPCALDTPGLAPLVGLAEGLVAFARSLAAAEGDRGVRVNTVTTQLWTAADEITGSPPYLPGYPGTTDEVAGAAALLLGAAASGVTGWTVPVDQGRTW